MQTVQLDWTDQLDLKRKCLIYLSLLSTVIFRLNFPRYKYFLFCKLHSKSTWKYEGALVLNLNGHDTPAAHRCK